MPGDTIVMAATGQDAAKDDQMEPRFYRAAMKIITGHVNKLDFTNDYQP